MPKGYTPRFHGLTRRDANPEDAFEAPIRRRCIIEAIPFDADRCIIALAAKAVRGIKWARVGGRIAYVVFTNEPTVAVRYVIGSQSLGITRLFDKDSEEIKRNPQILTHQSIKFLAPPVTLRLGFKNGKSGTNRRGTGKHRNVHHATPTRHMTFNSDWV